VTIWFMTMNASINTPPLGLLEVMLSYVVGLVKKQAGRRVVRGLC
jgi:hypothetical protein